MELPQTKARVNTYLREVTLTICMFFFVIGTLGLPNVFFFFYELDELMENKINIYHIASESRPGEQESAHWGAGDCSQS